LASRAQGIGRDESHKKSSAMRKHRAAIQLR